MTEVVDENPETRPFLPNLHCAYMDMLNEELAPYALDLALSLIALEDTSDGEGEDPKP